MANNEEIDDEAGVPEQIVEGLNAAYRRALQAGHPLVLVKDGYLVRVEPSGVTILEAAPPPVMVTNTKGRQGD